MTADFQRKPISIQNHGYHFLQKRHGFRPQICLSRIKRHGIILGADSITTRLAKPIPATKRCISSLMLCQSLRSTWIGSELGGNFGSCAISALAAGSLVALRLFLSSGYQTRRKPRSGSARSLKVIIHQFASPFEAKLFFMGVLDGTNATRDTHASRVVDRCKNFGNTELTRYGQGEGRPIVLSDNIGWITRSYPSSTNLKK
jgi:hypothetical protein